MESGDEDGMVDESKKSDCSRVSPYHNGQQEAIKQGKERQGNDHITRDWGLGAGRERRKQVGLHMLSLEASKSFEQS